MTDATTVGSSVAYRQRIAALAMIFLMGCAEPPGSSKTDSLFADKPDKAISDDTESSHGLAEKKPAALAYAPFETPLTAGEKKVYAARAKIIPVFSCKDLPLNTVAQRLRDQIDVDIDIDARALEDIGIVVNVPVTADLRGRSLDSVLKQLLRPLTVLGDSQRRDHDYDARGSGHDSDHTCV